MSAVMSEPSSPSNAEYFERATRVGRQFVQDVEGILPIIKRNRMESDRLGRVPDESVQAMTEVNVFRAMTPLQWGGLEMHPAYFFDGIMKLASADPSAAWIGGQLTVHAFEVALLSEETQAEFWANGPDTRASSAYAPLGKARPVDGGYILDGTWAFSSGVDHAEWVILGGGMRNYLVPRSDFEIIEGSWDVQGLRGTGSKSVRLSEVFVPERRAHKLEDTLNDRDPGKAVNDRPLYNLSWLSMFNSTMANSAIGMTLGGLNEIIDQTRVRQAKLGSGPSVAANPFMQLRMASVITRVRGVRDRHLNNWHGLFELACRDEQPSQEERLRVRYEASDAAGSCFEAFSEIWQHAGAAAIVTNNPLPHIFRDLMAMRNHGSAARDTAATSYMKAVFGLPGPEITNMGTMSFYK